MVCGTHAAVTAEAQHYQAYAPKDLGPTGTVLSLQAATTHLAANAYVLPQAELGQVYTLSEAYRTASGKDLHTTLTNLYQQTLAGWHHNVRSVDDSHTPDTLYRSRLQSLRRQLPALGLRIERTAGSMALTLHGHTWSYPAPLLFF